jgi:hypothetical protein
VDYHICSVRNAKQLCLSWVTVGTRHAVLFADLVAVDNKKLTVFVKVQVHYKVFGTGYKWTQWSYPYCTVR